MNKRSFWISIFLGLAICLGWAATQAAAQGTGEGAISGTITDPTGAVIAKAKVTATNTATNIATVRYSSPAGYYFITPLLPGKYTVQIVANGFQTLLQENVSLNALQNLAFDAVLSVGSESQTITVSTAPPMLETEGATLAFVMENETYSNLPIQMGGQMRDPTAFGMLTPGAQAANNGGRLPIVGGTGSYLGQLYVDGMPAETVSQQGDNRMVSNAMSIESVDQFQLVTSTPPAQYMGAGAENFTMKSGGLKYHGHVADFVRNTAFDTWGFLNPWVQVKNASGATVYAPKPVEHQNELSASGGGVVPHTGKKLFFFMAYDKFHYRNVKAPALMTIPTLLMRTGDFTELNGNPGTGYTGNVGNPAILYDPTTNNCIAGVCTRTAFSVIKGGLATNNIIPDNKISPIAKYMQSLLPAPSNTNLVNNYLGTSPGGFDNHAIDWRVDYDLSAKQRLSSVGLMGAVNYLNSYGAPLLPQPYTGGDLAHIFPKDFVVGHTYTISSNLVNQAKFSYTRFFQNIGNSTQGVTAWSPAAAGITNLPQGQAGQEFPGAGFNPTTAFSTAEQFWTGWNPTSENNNANSTQLTTPNNYAATDNLQWLKGKHSITMGLTFQWQEINNANPATYSGTLDLPYNGLSTANYAANSANLATTSGFAYASYLLGAVGNNLQFAANPNPHLGLQPLSEVGGRYKTIAPYVEDIYKLTRKLTLDIGMRWDYLPPFHEVKDRWTFLNPTLTNPLTSTPGMLQFAGNWGGPGVSIGKKTPVQTYWKNFGPRVSLAYEINPKTVFRAGFAQVFSQAGGVGGRAGAAAGTGATGFNMTATAASELTTGATAGPSFYLNNSAGFATAGPGGTNIQNTDLFGHGFAYPAAPTPGVAAQELNTGYYLSSTSPAVMANASSVNYADPYLSGRAPTLEMYNAGFERAITPNMTLAVNYMGNESHFIINSGTTGGNARGYWSNQLDPQYLAVLGPLRDSTSTGPGNGKPLLDAPATTANVAIAQAAMPSIPSRAFFTATANAIGVSSTATIAQMLTAFPQYSGVSDYWGNVGNFSYHALQVTLNQRMYKGLTFNVNYTFSKNIGDDGTFRSGFDVQQAAVSRGTKAWHQDRMDRSWTAVSIPHRINAFGVYELPFGRGHIGSNSMLVRALAGGWQFSGIYTFSTGTPIAVTNGTPCTTGTGTSATAPGQGQCMTDLNPAFTAANARINGKYGTGPNGKTACNLGTGAIGQTCTTVKYIDKTAFLNPTSVSTASTAVYLLGNAPRTAALHLRGPISWNIDTGLRRTFPIHAGVSFQIEANALNTLNHTNFGGPSGAWTGTTTTFGQVTGVTGSAPSRDFQFAGHLKF
jgi:hypothetical protein